MFWIRQQALTLLRELNLTLADFPDENGAIDGQLEHALERVFGAAPQANDTILASEPGDWAIGLPLTCLPQT